MSQRFCRWLGAAGLVIGLVACGGDPTAQLRSDVEAVTAAANARNAEDLRVRVADLQVTLDDQVDRGQLDPSRADQIRTFALRVAENAQLLAEPPAPPADEEVPESAGPDPEPAGDADKKKPDDRGKGAGKGNGGGKGPD